MGRLIDTDELIDILGFEDTQEERDENVGEIITLEDIDRIPTAYDPDKVVAQLEEVEKIMTSPVNKDCFGEECRASDCTVCLISKAIEIVKGGGVDAKTDS